MIQASKGGAAQRTEQKTQVQQYMAVFASASRQTTHIPFRHIFMKPPTSCSSNTFPKTSKGRGSRVLCMFTAQIRKEAVCLVLRQSMSRVCPFRPNLEPPARPRFAKNGGGQDQGIKGECILQVCTVALVRSSTELDSDIHKKTVDGGCGV